MLIYRITVPVASIAVPAVPDLREDTRTFHVAHGHENRPLSLSCPYYYFSVRKFFISYSLSFPWYQE